MRDHFVDPVKPSDPKAQDKGRKADMSRPGASPQRKKKAGVPGKNPETFTAERRGNETRVDVREVEVAEDGEVLDSREGAKKGK